MRLHINDETLHDFVKTNFVVGTTDNPVYQCATCGIKGHKEADELVFKNDQTPTGLFYGCTGIVSDEFTSKAYVLVAPPWCEGATNFKEGDIAFSCPFPGNVEFRTDNLYTHITKEVWLMGSVPFRVMEGEYREATAKELSDFLEGRETW